MTLAREPLVVLMPMRHQSVRVPGKNFRMLGGVPLFHHVVRMLLACPVISRIVIDTDSDTIREDVGHNFPEVTLVERPRHLRGDDVPMTEVLRHDADQFPADLYLQTHSTNPFLRAETVQSALETWGGIGGSHDSLFSVTRLQARLWDKEHRPVNHDPAELLRTQDLSPLFVENSNLYIYPEELIRTRRRRIGDSPYLFEMDSIEAIDIDDEQGFRLADRLFQTQ